MVLHGPSASQVGQFCLPGLVVCRLTWTGGVAVWGGVIILFVVCGWLILL